jgi:Flp pilus assembly CpaF family ATPase
MTKIQKAVEWGANETDPLFREFREWEFKVGPDLPWMTERSQRAKWELHLTGSLWESSWRMLLPLMRRKGVSEIMTSGPGHLWIENRDGFLLTSLNFNRERVPGWFLTNLPSRDDLMQGLALIHGAMSKREVWSSKTPGGDVHIEGNLEDGSRLMALLPPCSTDSEVLMNIRRFSPVRLTRQDFISSGSLTEEAADAMEMAVAAHATAILGAGTGAGKTTMLEWLMSSIPHHEAPLTIEDTPELQIQHPLYRGMRTRDKVSNADDSFQDMNMTSLLKAALRARPDWIIAGEIRDSADPRSSPADAFINAIQSGHAGACTLHAHDDYGALTRLESMLRSARANMKDESLRMTVGESVRLIVILRRHNETCIEPTTMARLLRPKRRVHSVSEVLGSDGHGYFVHRLFATRFVQVEHEVRGEIVAVTSEPELAMVGIPFYGIELEDQGFAMPAWWEDGKRRFGHLIPRKGRVEMASGMLDAALAALVPKAGE